jgi:hypothetical protein
MAAEDPHPFERLRGVLGGARHPAPFDGFMAHEPIMLERFQR